MSCFSAADESAHYGFSVCLLLDRYRDALGWERYCSSSMQTEKP